MLGEEGGIEIGEQRIPRTGTEKVSLVLGEGVSLIAEWYYNTKIANEPQVSSSPG